MSTIRLCEETNMDCEGVKCPGCILADGGTWDGSKWTYPEDMQEFVSRRAQKRALEGCVKYGHIGSPKCVLCGSALV